MLLSLIILIQILWCIFGECIILEFVDKKNCNIGDLNYVVTFLLTLYILNKTIKLYKKN